MAEGRGDFAAPLLFDDEHEAAGRALDRHAGNGLDEDVGACFRNDHVLRQPRRIKWTRRKPFGNIGFNDQTG